MVKLETFVIKTLKKKDISGEKNVHRKKKSLWMKVIKKEDILSEKNIDWKKKFGNRINLKKDILSEKNIRCKKKFISRNKTAVSGALGLLRGWFDRGVQIKVIWSQKNSQVKIKVVPKKLL